MKRTAIVFSSISNRVVTRVTRRRAAGILLLAIAIASESQAMAEPGGTFTVPGTSDAVIIKPIGLQNVTDLRFGRIIRPTSGGTLQIAFNGAATEIGGVAGRAISTPQTTNGRGPGALAAFGDPNRLFLTYIAAETIVSNGSAQMRVDQFQISGRGFFGLRAFDNDGYQGMLIGGRLTIPANQPVGSYTGTFPVTILYL